MSAPYLQVLIDGPLAGCFSYRCPTEGPEPAGHWVTVPWSKGRRTGLALQRHDASALPAGLKAEDIKPIEAVHKDLPAPSPEWLGFLRFVARYYHGSLADLAVGNLPKLLRTPPTARSRKDAVARLEDFSATLDDGHDAPSTAPELNAEQQAVLAELCTWQGARPDGSAPAMPSPEASPGSPAPPPLQPLLRTGRSAPCGLAPRPIHPSHRGPPGLPPVHGCCTASPAAARRRSICTGWSAFWPHSRMFRCS